MIIDNNVRLEAAALPFLFILTVFLFVRYATSSELNRRFRLLVVSTFAAAVLGVLTHSARVVHTLSPFAIFVLTTLYLAAANYNAYLLLRYVAVYVEFRGKTFLRFCHAMLALSFAILVFNLFTGMFFSVGEDGLLVQGANYTLLHAGFVLFFVGAAFLLQNINQQFYENAQFILMNLLFFLLIDAFIYQYLFNERVLIVYVAATILLYITFFYLEAPALRELADTESRMNALLAETGRATERVSAASRSKSDFLANTSHEIRTPMNAILGMNDMIEKEAADEKTREASRHIRHAGEGLLTIINNILDISKIESGKMELYPTRFFLSETVEDIVSRVEGRIREKNLDFLIKINEELPEHLRADEDAIRRVVVNLLDNAIKYTDQGSITLHVLGGHPASEHLDPERENLPAGVRDTDRIHLQFMVEDTGIGMRKEEMDKLYEAFERINMKETQSVQGAGLGLALVWNLTRMMGGEVRAESVYGEGSVFTVDLPVGVVTEGFTGTVAEYEKERAAKRLSNDESAEESLPSCAGKRFLIVDDTQVNLVVAKSILETTGARIDLAMSGEECLDMALSKRYDIIFLDHQMPGMDGIETLRLLREIGSGNDTRENKSKDTPVIALTANAGGEARALYEKEGFDGYLAKPIRPQELAKILSR